METSVIVYRNPMEKAFWELATSANMISLAIGMVVFFGLLYLFFSHVIPAIIGKTPNVRRYVLRKKLEVWSLWFSSIVGLIVTYLAWV